METRHKSDMHTSHTRRSSVTAEIRQVQNVALADATAKAGVSPWTKAMFKVRILPNLNYRRSDIFSCTSVSSLQH
jgi:hypothetical protein